MSPSPQGVPKKKAQPVTHPESPELALKRRNLHRSISEDEVTFSYLSPPPPPPSLLAHDAVNAMYITVTS